MITETKVESDVEEDNGEDVDIEDNGATDLYENDLLFGFLWNDGYHPCIKQDGFYQENLSWRDDDLPSDGLTPQSDLYDGPGPKSHQGIGTKFNTVLGACGIGSGFT